MRMRLQEETSGCRTEVTAPGNDITFFVMSGDCTSPPSLQVRSAEYCRKADDPTEVCLARRRLTARPILDPSHRSCQIGGACRQFRSGPLLELARFKVGRAGLLPLHDNDVALAGKVVRHFLEPTCVTNCRASWTGFPKRPSRDRSFVVFGTSPTISLGSQGQSSTACANGLCFGMNEESVSLDD